jgi:cystathionine gamma-synthase
MSDDPNPCQVATRVVRAGLESDTQHHAVVPPLYLTTNFAFTAFGEKGRYDYSRSGNPTRDALATALADLEGGAGAVVTASGMAAVTLVSQLVGPTDLVVAPHDCYGGTYRLFSALAHRGVLRIEFIDQTDAVAVASAMKRKPALVWIETPSNPLLRVADVRSIAAAAHEQGALVATDNTFLSPVWQQPIALGSDLVVHSTTKYLNGHSDVVGGVVIAATPALQQQLEWWGNATGLIGAPFDSFLTLRGLRTLHVRMQAHAANAAAVADLLSQDSAVQAVHFPGLDTHPQHALARKQQSGFGAMVSFELAGGLNQVRAFFDGLKCFSLAESLGGVESLAAHPTTMTHAALDAETRARAGITDGLIRLSVGIEDVRDLLADLRAALDRVRRSPR